MEATADNYRVASEVIELLQKNNCTVAQASEILYFATISIAKTSLVQFNGRLSYD